MHANTLHVLVQQPFNSLTAPADFNEIFFNPYTLNFIPHPSAFPILCGRGFRTTHC